MKRLGRRAVLGAALACAASAALAPGAQAGVVTTSDDGNTPGTLRTVVQNAAPGEVITFAAGVNPVLQNLSPSNDFINVTQDITLVGNGIAQTTITGSGADQVFVVGEFVGLSKTITIRALTITGGRVPPPTGGNQAGGGAAIALLGGNLIIDGVGFSDNRAASGPNGNQGSGCSIGTCGTGGEGANGGSGGAIANNGGPATLTIRNSSFHDNFAGNGGNGGQGGTGTGGLAQGGDGGNGAIGGFGGAIVSIVPTEITNTTFSNNHSGAGGDGGSGGSGGFGGNPGHGGNGGDGGAVTWVTITAPPSLVITGSTFNGNLAGTGGTGGGGFFGALGGSGGSGGAVSTTGATIVNSTFTANHAGAGGPGGSGTQVGGGGAGGNGGAVSGVMVMRGATVAANQAGGGGAGSATGSPGSGGGVWGTPNLIGTVIASNLVGGSPANPDSNCGGTTPSGSFDLSFPGGTGCSGAVGNPLLGPLASNGGPTQTMALGAGSPAIDQWPASGANCPPSDQRGIGRPQGPACDIGAFEVVVPPVQTTASQGPGFNLKAAIKRCKKKFPKGPKRKKCIRKAKRRAQTRSSGET